MCVYVCVCVCVCVIRHHHSKVSSCSLNPTCDVLVSPCISSCDDSLSNSKDASLNKGFDWRRIIDLFINNDINCQIVICPNVSAEKSDLGTDALGGGRGAAPNLTF